MKPLGANEVSADRRFLPDFCSTSLISALHSSSSGITYSPTKALMIDLAMVLSTSLSSWQQTSSLVASSTIYLAIRKASSGFRSNGQASSFSFISFMVTQWLLHLLSFREIKLSSSLVRLRLKQSLIESIVSRQYMKRSTNSFFRWSIWEGFTCRIFCACGLCLKYDFLIMRDSMMRPLSLVVLEPSSDCPSISSSDIILISFRFSVFICITREEFRMLGGSLRVLSKRVFTLLRLVSFYPSKEVSDFSRLISISLEFSWQGFLLESEVGTGSIRKGSSPVFRQERMVERYWISCVNFSISSSFSERARLNIVFSVSNLKFSRSLSISTELRYFSSCSCSCVFIFWMTSAWPLISLFILRSLISALWHSLDLSVSSLSRYSIFFVFSSIVSFIMLILILILACLLSQFSTLFSRATRVELKPSSQAILCLCSSFHLSLLKICPLSAITRISSS